MAPCPDIDVASQGDTIEEAIRSPREAVALFLECAPPEEVARRRSRGTPNLPFDENTPANPDAPAVL